MGQESGGDKPDWAPLLQAPLEVIKRLKDEPLLLIGMGATVVLAIIAMFAPERGRFYAWLLTGLVLILSLLRTIALESRKRRSRSESPPGSSTNLKLGHQSKITDTRISTRGSRARTSIESGRRTTIQGVSINTGSERPAEIPKPASDDA